MGRIINTESKGLFHFSGGKGEGVSLGRLLVAVAACGVNRPLDTPYGALLHRRYVDGIHVSHPVLSICVAPQRQLSRAALLALAQLRERVERFGSH